MVTDRREVGIIGAKDGINLVVPVGRSLWIGFIVTKVALMLDRFIQQGVLQVMQQRWDRTFSEHSYGFRPGRSAHQAVAQAQRYIAEGRHWVVDIDLEQFFDRVHHDRLLETRPKSPN